MELVKFRLLRLLELDYVSLRVPSVENSVASEVPGACFRLEVTARSLDCAPNLREACYDEGGLERSFLAWKGRLLNGDSSCVLAGYGVDDDLVAMTSQEIVRCV